MFGERSELCQEISGIVVLQGNQTEIQKTREKFRVRGHQVFTVDENYENFEYSQLKTG